MRLEALWRNAMREPGGGRPRTRLLVAGDLQEGGEVSLRAGQVHQLRTVLRLGEGDRILVFNGRDGEWLASIESLSRGAGYLACVERVREQRAPPDLWLLFAPLKRERTDWMAEKGAEIGCRRIVPIMTARTNSRRVRTDRLQAHAVEAAEQCGLLSVPEVAEAEALDTVLDAWPQDRQLMFCDERGGSAPIRNALDRFDAGMPWAVLVGPEGGFLEAEAERIAAMPMSVPVSLGPRILRADTAAVAALALWQAMLGDWDRA